MVTLRVDETDVPTLFACLGLGTLYAMQEGVVSAEAGIWSMGAPRTWEPVAELLNRSAILEVFQVADELSTIKELMPDKFHETLLHLIQQLQASLSDMENPAWCLTVTLEGDETN